MTAPVRPADWEPLVLLDEDVARVAARHVLLWSVYDGAGADKLSERAAIVTEGRNALSIKQGWGHSSCGDEEWFMQECLGNRQPCVNRAALKSATHPGYCFGGAVNNLSRVQTHPDFVRGPIKTQMGAGDGLLMDPNNMHIAVVIKHDLAAKLLIVAQYGGTMGKVGIDGRLSEYPSDWHPNIIGQQVRGLEFDGVYVRAENKATGAKSARKVIGHLPLWATIQRAERAGQLELAYVPPGMPKP